jgi:phage I-like protein
MAFWNKDEENKEDKKEDKVDDVELKPADVKAKLDKIDSLESGITELKSKSAVLDRMTTFLNEQDELKASKVREEQAKKNQQSQEELDEEWLTDPKTAMNKQMRPLVEATVNNTATNTIRGMVEADPDKYGLYSDPVFKQKMDGLIFNMPLKDRTNPVAIENCFYVAKGQNEEAIKEGKIKSRFAAASSSGTGTDGQSGSKKDALPTLSDAEKKAARVFGMKEEDYAAKKKEYVYGV